MIVKKSLLIFSLMILMVISTLMMGCIDQQITQDQLTANIDSGYAALETYQLDMDLTVSLSEQLDGESTDMVFLIHGSYFINIPHKKARIEMSMTMPEALQAEGAPEIVEASIYMIDNTMYVGNRQISEMPSQVQWIKMAIPQPDYEQMLATQNMVGQLSGMLSSMYGIALTDKTMVNSTDCYEATITPDMKQLFTLFTLMQNTGGLNFGDLDSAQMDELMSSVENLSIKQWFDKGTFAPVKTSMNMSIESPDESFSMDMNAILEFKNLNQELPLKLPAEAQGAVDLMDMMEAMDSVQVN